jgi:predicted Rossmann fold nucleotide-binding protein DprA/Smf involved in DNA uptake
MTELPSLHQLGNERLLALPKVAFLCSRTCPPEAARKARLWAGAQRDSGILVISGFHSRIEKEVLQELLSGRQPLIVALARGIGSRLPAELEAPLAAGRLLIVSRYADSVTHACEESCYQRNRLMMQLAERTVVAWASPGGSLERLCREWSAAPVSFL